MEKKQRPISESTLRTDLGELAHSFARELAVTCKKVAIYGPNHPQARRAVDKPFVVLGQIFPSKRYVNLSIQQGQLYVLNIQLKETIFNSQVIQFLQYADLSTLVFERGLSASELLLFIEKFVTRESGGAAEGRLDKFLQARKIDKIQANSEFAFDLFNNQRHYLGAVLGDYSARRFCVDQLPDDLDELLTISAEDESALLKRGIDFIPEVVRYVLPEKIGQLPIEGIRSQLKAHAEQLKQADNEIDRDQIARHMVNVLALLECHADRKKLLDHFDEELKQQIDGFEELGDPGTATGKIRFEVRLETDQMIARHFDESPKRPAPSELANAFVRLTTTGQTQHAEEVHAFLMDRLGDTNGVYRQHALEVLIEITQRLNYEQSYPTIVKLVDSVIERLNAERETFEYSELILHLFDGCLKVRQYSLIAKLVENMAARRKITQGVAVYDSLSVKKAFANINHEVAINQLVTELVDGEFETGNMIRSILIGIGSEEIAMALSEIISHPKRVVRQQSLRVLAELGKAALGVFSRLLMDDSWFERAPDRHELPDQQWYVLRNSIFVLGSLGDEEGIPSLRLRMSDKDIRIRREIVTSLEKIGGEEVIDLLIMMAEDPVPEIREKALRTVGLIGDDDCVPLLIDVARRNHGLASIAIWAIGQAGGSEAYDFLSELLDENQKSLSEIAGDQISKDDLRVASVKALGSLDDGRAKATIESFQTKLSTTQKLFFKNSPLQKAISEVLNQ